MDQALRSAWRAIGRAAAPRGPLRTTVEHYDLGNRFFQAWLDETMTYSSALFERPGMTLEEAQAGEVPSDRRRHGPATRDAGVGDRLRLGGFAAFAASEIGCHVTTITVSKEQAAWVEQMAAERRLRDRVAVRLEDFEVTAGSFDAVVSIEMIESIPAWRWPAFFRTVHDRLEPGGRAGLQIITVADRHWKSSNANLDFIRRYVFPGSQVPGPSVLRHDAAAADLCWIEAAGFGWSYAQTLAAWRTRFDAAWPQIAALGFDDRFKRMWQYYLSYCEGGFRSGRVDVGQIVLERPAAPLLLQPASGRIGAGYPKAPMRSGSRHGRNTERCRDVAELLHPPAHVGPVGVAADRLPHGVERPHPTRIGPGARHPLPVPGVVGGVAVEEQAREDRRPSCHGTPSRRVRKDAVIMRARLCIHPSCRSCRMPASTSGTPVIP